MRVLSIENNFVVNVFEVPDNAEMSEDNSSVKWGDSVICCPDGQSLHFDVSGSVGVGFELKNGTWDRPETSVPLDIKRAIKVSSVETHANEKLSIGYKVSDEEHVSLSDAARADLSAMALTASLAIGGLTSWPESYSRGWITVENGRISLPNPQDGITLAASVGDYYAKIKQYSRDLKDKIIAAKTSAALDAIDISEGWP